MSSGIPDVVVLSGNPTDDEIAALVVAVAALATGHGPELASVTTLPVSWESHEPHTPPDGWASGDGRHLRRVI